MQLSLKVFAYPYSLYHKSLWNIVLNRFPLQSLTDTPQSKEGHLNLSAFQFVYPL